MKIFEKLKIDWNKPASNTFKLVLVLISFLFMYLVISLLFSNNTLYIPVSSSVEAGVYKVDRNIKNINKGDYIVYKIPEKYQSYMDEELQKLDTIKKVYAIENDVIEVKENKIYINGEYKGDLLEEIPTKLPEKYIVKSDEYFVFSESPTSLDSRYYGAISKTDIKGVGKLVKLIF